MELGTVPTDKELRDFPTMLHFRLGSLTLIDTFSIQFDQSPETVHKQTGSDEVQQIPSGVR